MNTLSLCMIVKDEELALPRLLKVAPIFADEIIAVDTGSTDRTVEICKTAGCKVYFYTWNNDFASARNYSLSLGKCDYLMWLDADDIVTEERAASIKRLKTSLSADMVMLPYYMGEPPKTVFWRERIFRRDMGYEFSGRVHEAIEPRGKIIYENIPIVHSKLKPRDKMRNLEIMKNVLAQKGTFGGREAFYYGSELYYNGKFDEARIWLKKFMREPGSRADKGQAALYLSEICDDKLKELEGGLKFVFAPDLLCKMGEIYLSRKDIRAAKNCFLTALEADENVTFFNPEATGYLPHIRLCYCYWHLGNKSKSEFHNNMALVFKPNDRFALHNSTLFK